MEEAQLIGECLRGKARAQKTLFEKFAPRMMAVCMRYMKDKPEAEDVFQIGMVKVFTKLSEKKIVDPKNECTMSAKPIKYLNWDIGDILKNRL